MTTDICGNTVYYEDVGEGKPILLLHGWGGSSESFLPLLRDLSANHRVIAPDFPGQGKSPEPPEPWSVTEYAEMIRGFCDALDIRGCDILAHSFGGRVALYLAATWPDYAGKLLLTGCAGIPPVKTKKQDVRRTAYRLLSRLASPKFFGEALSGRMREALVQKFGSADYKALTPSMRKTFNHILAQDLSWTLPQIQSPTLLVWGEDDTATPLWMGKKMEREIPDAALIPFPNAGHFAYLDCYAKFLPIAREYFAQ